MDQIGAPDYGEETPETIDEVRAKLASFNPSEDPDCPDVRFPCSCLDPVSLKNKSEDFFILQIHVFQRHWLRFFYAFKLTFGDLCG